LPPNNFEPPSTIVTSITSLSFKGKYFMVDELATINIVEILNGPIVIQPKKKRKANWCTPNSSKDPKVGPNET
jgi:hypothetical protein